MASPFSAEESIGSSLDSIIPSGVGRPDCVLEGSVREDTAADALLAGPSTVAAEKNSDDTVDVLRFAVPPDELETKGSE